MYNLYNTEIFLYLVKIKKKNQKKKKTLRLRLIPIYPRSTSNPEVGPESSGSLSNSESVHHTLIFYLTSG